MRLFLSLIVMFAAMASVCEAGVRRTVIVQQEVVQAAPVSVEGPVATVVVRDRQARRLLKTQRTTTRTVTTTR